MKPKELVKKWVELFNNADIEGLVELYHDHAVNHQVAHDPVSGKPAIKEMLAKEFSVADMTCIIENVFEDGEWAIMEWKDPLGLRGCGFFHVISDKIMLQRGYWDKLSFLRQHNMPFPKE